MDPRTARDDAASSAFGGPGVSVSSPGGSAPSAPRSERVPSQSRAPVASLSAAKRRALVTCLNPSGLRKKAGAWHGAENAKPVSGVTVADLARDGMLTLIMEHRSCSAQLTERGIWFARTLLDGGAPP
jgi:hypothetical protein